MKRLAQVSSFGGWVIRRPGDPVAVVPGARQRQLLCWLLLAPWGPPLEVVNLCDAMWPTVDGDTARSNFSSTARRLRQLLGGPEALLVTGGTVALNDRFCRTDLDLLRMLSRHPTRPCDPARAGRLARWLLQLCRGYNPVLLGAADTDEMADRRRALGAAWQQVSWRVIDQLDAHDALLGLALCVCLDRHGLADERILLQWDRIAAQGLSGRS